MQYYAQCVGLADSLIHGDMSLRRHGIEPAVSGFAYHANSARGINPQNVIRGIVFRPEHEGSVFLVGCDGFEELHFNANLYIVENIAIIKELRGHVFAVRERQRSVVDGLVGPGGVGDRPLRIARLKVRLHEYFARTSGKQRRAQYKKRTENEDNSTTTHVRVSRAAVAL